MSEELMIDVAIAIEKEFPNIKYKLSKGTDQMIRVKVGVGGQTFGIGCAHASDIVEGVRSLLKAAGVCPACGMRRINNGKLPPTFETHYNRIGYGLPLSQEQASDRVCRHNSKPGCLGLEGKP